MSGGKSEEITVGYKYYVGMVLAVCEAADAITEIRIGERIAWTGSLSGGTLFIDEPELFGGEDREGGVVGAVDIQMGGPTQQKNNYLLSKIASVPALRGFVSLVLRQLYLGNIPRFKPWAITAVRQPVGWTGAISSAIGANGDINAMHFVYELIHDHRWGTRYGEQRVDIDSFNYAASVLLSEGLGFSWFWDDPDVDIEAFMKTVMAHVDGSLYLDPATAKWRVKLHRDDYDPETLEWLDESNIQDVPSHKTPGWGDLVNEVVVEYVDGEGSEPTWKKQTVSIQNLAAIENQAGRIVTKTINYSGVTNSEVANKLCARDLRQLSTPLLSATLVLTSDQASLQPGDVRKLKHADYGIEEVIVRIVEVQYGSLDDGSVTVKVVEDIFSNADSEFAAPLPTEWSDPISEPAPAPFRKLTEATYYHIAQELSDNDALLGEIADTAGFLFTQAVRPSDDAFNYEVHVDTGGGYKIDGQKGHFTPSTTNAALVPAEVQSVIAIDAGVDLDLVSVPALAYWGDEIIEVTALDIGLGVLTAKRGVLDTVPVEHAVGDRLFFGRGFQSKSMTEYNETEQISVRMLPSTSRGRLPLASAPTDQITFDARFFRPWPPARIRVNGLDFPAQVTGANIVSWSHRDRTLQTGAIVDQNANSIGPEPGTTYTVRIFDGDTQALRRTVNGIAGTSYEYTEAQEVADGGYIGTITWQVEAVRDGYASWQFQERTAELHGYGRRYGESYGGIV